MRVNGWVRELLLLLKLVGVPHHIFNDTTCACTRKLFVPGSIKGRWAGHVCVMYRYQIVKTTTASAKKRQHQTQYRTYSLAGTL